MELYQIVILAVVEGITEFLPVSSTFHLILTSSLLGVAQSDFSKLFEVFIQSGAILSVLILYWKTFTKDRALMLRIGASFIPTAIVGLVLYKVIKTIFFETPWLMVVMFVVIGIVFLVTEYLVSRDRITLSRKAEALSLKEAVLVGLIQALAVVPGVSRAGAVMLGMMFLRFRRDESARYSFLLSVPTIFAASVLDLYKMRAVLVGHSDYVAFLILGFLVAFASSFVFVKWFITYLKTNTLIPFGWYRIGLSLLLVALSFLGVWRFI